MRLKSRIKLAWDRLWVRKDEFDKSLDLDCTLMSTMTDEEWESYQFDLIKRRNAAHEKDLKNN